MHKTGLFFALLLMIALLTACAQSQPAAAPAQTLLVTSDGKDGKTFTAQDLQALGEAKATFREVEYVGAHLAGVIQAAGFDPQAIKAVKAVAVDGFSANYDPALFLREDSLVSYARSGGALAEDEGTFRMVLPDQEGKLNVRQLVELRIVP